MSQNQPMGSDGSSSPSTGKRYSASEGSSNPVPAQPSASAVAPRIRRRNRMITSCLECRRRKLKCDKTHPCTNCTKFARDCVFLAPALDSASQLKLTEIKEKMGSLERVLEQDVARNNARRELRKGDFEGAQHGGTYDDFEFAPEPEDEKELEPSPLAVLDAAYDEDADDDLMDLGVQMGKLRLTDRLGGFFRPKMSEELTVSLTDARNDRRPSAEKALTPDPTQSIPSMPAYFVAPGPTYIAPTSSFFFATGSHGNSLIDFLPSKYAADRLIQQYWYAVHPIARTVHRPSFQRRYDIFWNEVALGIEPVGSLQALVFAAMFAGVVSMPEGTILDDFGVAKKDLQENFQQGTETALIRANLLRTTKTETMQAFVIYMISLCRDQISRAHSALVGMGIRLAECMALHRDGTGYGLKPIEIHVRRLVWYQLCYLDIRTCEAQGPRPGIRQEEFDTRFPLNVNDSDLDQDITPTKSAERWTDMTFSLIRMECNEMMRTLWFDRPKLEKKQISLTAVLGKIENFRKMTEEKYLPWMDDSIPIQQCARAVLNILLRRMHIMILHRYHNSVAVRIPDRLRQIILTSGTELLESAILLETHRPLAPWAWYSGAIQQYQVAFLLLGEVWAYPMRKESDRIWRCLDFVFEPPADLTRDQKARLILTEIRDRLGVYSQARKLRAPTGMLQRIGMSPPRRAGDDGSAMSPVDVGPGADAVVQIGVERVPTPIMGVRFRTDDGPDPAPPESRVESQAPRLTSGTSAPPTMSNRMTPDMNMTDELMNDIDWNEWDKLFPPDVNNGELNMPSFS
ncbi:hypothetical protein MMC17_009949 [Xylographa soralifera]|nr:hypothetical protein [Xylographa soralifera]